MTKQAKTQGAPHATTPWQRWYGEMARKTAVYDDLVAARADAIQQDYLEEGRAIGRAAAYRLAEHDDAVPPDVTGLCDADAWNILDRWLLTATDVPESTRAAVEAECTTLIDELRAACAAQDRAARISQ